MGKPARAPIPEWEWDEIGADPLPGHPAANPLGVLTDPRTYGAIFYLLTSLGTGVAYFTWAVVGLTVSVSLVVVLVGIPLLMMFLMSVRFVGVLEGWLVEGLLGVRMSRSSPGSTLDLAGGDRGVLGAFLDPRTWSTLANMILMLPLGIAYFVLVVVGLTVPVSLTLGSLIDLATGSEYARIQLGFVGAEPEVGPALLIGLAALGVVLLWLMLLVIRGVGMLHGRLARAVLVRE
ncbi:sensor domain-containing protein [Tautonia plasticadhaerens]|uniref:Putative sensor domain-containing protein n=1 Tax=Tautonia plasticadhaerens TaxID=2527974 RepID=A0A518HCT3_9BACT|nr:sensor domain-containing protein [Tautonia plasticadhaerens]QDV38675.1 hypothetical protein ElP_66300 [Tautonia plasticadhaerens]